MGKQAIAFLQPGWADWEAGHVLPLLREHFGVSVRTATPDGKPQVSIGGLEAKADASFAEVKPTDADIFLAIGSDAWTGFHDERFFGLLREARPHQQRQGLAGRPCPRLRRRRSLSRLRPGGRRRQAGQRPRPRAEHLRHRHRAAREAGGGEGTGGVRGGEPAGVVGLNR